tara:strand:- start:121 stop:1050 length:930 start_codon:yes stop_codon:yes gene_type:complete
MLPFKKTYLIILISITIFILSFIFLNKLFCFNVSPYGFINGYSSLPHNSNYCLNDKDNKVYFITNDFGARLLSRDESKSSIKVFGDSQVLGLDVNTIDHHYLDTIYSNKNLIIFAAPNNGPYEVLNSVELNTQAHDKIIITFNSSTDIFRIRDSYNFYDYVSLDINKAYYLVNFPILYDFIQWYSFLNKDKKNKLSNNKWMQDLFLNYKNQEILENFENYFLNFSSLIKINKLNYEYYITHPYWLYNIVDNELVIDNETYKKYDDLTRLINLKFPFIKFSKIENKNIHISDLTYDKRHLRSKNYEFDKF